MHALNRAGSPRSCFCLIVSSQHFRGKLFHGKLLSAVLGWAHSFLKQEIINFPSAVWAMLALRLTCKLTLHLVVKLFGPFLFNFITQVLPFYQLLVSRNVPLTDQYKNKININSFIFVTSQCDTHYFEPHRTKSRCLFAVQTCTRSVSLPTKETLWKECECNIKLECQKGATKVTAPLGSRAVAWLARPKAGQTQGTCIAPLQCLIPRRAGKVLQLSAYGATAFCSSGKCLRSDTEVQVRADTWHFKNTWHLWSALQLLTESL